MHRFCRAPFVLGFTSTLPPLQWLHPPWNGRWKLKFDGGFDYITSVSHQGGVVVRDLMGHQFLHTQLQAHLLGLNLILQQPTLPTGILQQRDANNKKSSIVSNDALEDYEFMEENQGSTESVTAIGRLICSETKLILLLTSKLIPTPA